MIVCCRGWGAVICVLDNMLHSLHLVYRPLCEYHDRLITE